MPTFSKISEHRLNCQLWLLTIQITKGICKVAKLATLLKSQYHETVFFFKLINQLTNFVIFLRFIV